MTERERLLKLVNSFMENATDELLYGGDFDDFFTDYLLDNGVIVPPVKYRSKVYTVILDKIIEEYEVASYTVDSDGFSFIHLALVQNCNIYGRTLSINDFNKQFYLTREEAEKALEKRSE